MNAPKITKLILASLIFASSGTIFSKIPNQKNLAKTNTKSFIDDTGVVVIFKRISDGGESEYLMLKRNVAGKFGFGKFGFPGGMVERNETIKEAACREVKEEIGINLSPEDLSIVHVLRLRQKCDPETKKATLVLTAYYLEVKDWEGLPTNLEPEKHSSLDWLKIEQSCEEIIPLNLDAIESIENGVLFSSRGWEPDSYKTTY